MESKQEEVAPVWVEDVQAGGYQQGFCFYNDLYAADLAKGKGRAAVKVDVYPSSAMVPRERKEYEGDKVFRANSASLQEANDMTALTYLEEPNMLRCLHGRYDKDKIYTSIAGVLVAVNPFRNLGIYTRDVMQQYRGERRLDLLDPHVFRVAERAYQNLVQKRENQSMICCGESGSGKTESTKMLMRYLANVKLLGDSAAAAAPADGQPLVSKVEQQVLQANPMLEAFGNARTLMNDNSSRFAKFTKLFVSNDEHRIVGAHTETYLLEKSRVVNPPKGTRNFHVFYQLCAGDWAQKLGLPSAAEFRYLAAGECLTLRNVKDSDRWTELRECMTTMNLTEDEQLGLFNVIAAVMYLGNVQFQDGTGADADADDSKSNSPSLSPESEQAIERAASFLNVETATLRKRLLTRSITVARETIQKKMGAEEAVANRDAIAKALYNALFNWVVTKINQVLFQGETSEEHVRWIGILDVFGFECFELNSFEQFCINFANEKLQNFFNGHILKSEQEQYRREGIFWTPINIPDNSDVIQLIVSKPSGILCLLDSACIVPRGSAATFHSNLFTMHKGHARLIEARPPKATAGKGRRAGGGGGGGAGSSRRQAKYYGFTVRHYAGNVTYDAEHFRSKNTDSTHPDTVRMFWSSESVLVKALFVEQMAEIDDASNQGARFQSVGTTFSRQLTQLMKTLEATTPYFIRCASPNGNQAPNDFQWAYVRPQLVCGGLVEALRMLKFGYPSRVSYDVILSKYGHALQPPPSNLNARNFCEAILVAFGLGVREYQMGLTKVFFRPGKQEFLDSIFRRSEEPLTPELDRAIRRWLIKRRLQRVASSVRVFVRFRNRLQHIRAAHKFRRAIRLGMIYIATLRACLKRVRRLRGARAGAVQYIQSFWRHYSQRKAINRVLQKRIRSRRKQMFKFGGVDAKTVEELNMLRVQMKSAKKKQEAEKKKLEQFRKEAIEKELRLQKEMEAKKAALENLQSEFEQLKQREIDSEKQQQIMEALKADTERLRRENLEASRQAQLIVQQREAEAKRREAELLKLKEESDRRRQEAERTRQEAIRMQEEERKRRDADLERIRRETERLKQEAEERQRRAAEELRRREEENRKKEEELRKLAVERMKEEQSHKAITEELRQQREVERQQKEEQARRLREEIEKMRANLEKESEMATEEIRRREEENRRKERDLEALRQEKERQRREAAELLEQQKRKLEQEQAEKAAALKRFQMESERTRALQKQQAEEAARKLQEREAENRRKEAILAKLTEDAARMRREHEEAVKRAQETLQKQESDAQSKIRELHEQRAKVEEEYRLESKRQEEEAKRVLNESLQQRDSEHMSAIDKMRAEHEAQVKKLQMLIVERDDEIDRLHDEAESEQEKHDGVRRDLEEQLRVSKAETAERDAQIKKLEAEMAKMREVHAEVSAYSQRLLEEKEEELTQEIISHRADVDELRKKLAAQVKATEKLQLDHDDMLAHFQQHMKREAEEKTKQEDTSWLREVSVRTRQVTAVEERPDMATMLNASILSQKKAVDFVRALRTKYGWLNKQRPGNKLVGTKAKQRYMMLEGGTLLWFADPPKTADPALRKPLGSLELKNYHFIEYNHDDDDVDTPDGAEDERKRAGSVVHEKFDNHKFVLQLVPLAKGQGAAMNLTAPKQPKDKGAIEEIMSWVHEINRRIAIMRYLDEVFTEDQRQAKGCREVLDFVCDSSLSSLVVENKVSDIHTAMVGLREPLSVRHNLRLITLTNIMLSDPSVEVLSAVIRRNNHIREVNLMHNIISGKGASHLAEALRHNRSVATVKLSHNNIGDEGAIALALALPHHKSLQRLTLAANKISDAGAVAIAKHLIESGPKHAFPQIELQENLVGDAGAKAIGEACKANSTIYKVNLAANVISDEGAAALAEALQSSDNGVTDLRLSDNRISNPGALALARLLKAKETVLAIDLSHNRLLSRTGVVALVDTDFPLEFSLLKVIRDPPVSRKRNSAIFKQAPRMVITVDEE